MQNLFPTFFSEASAKGARSTALHSLQWGMGMLLCALPICIWASAPAWILILLAVAFALVLITFLCAYIFLLGKDPDSLRSESFNLSKMAIERGLVGDSNRGLVDVREVGGKSVSSGPLLIDDKNKSK